MSAIPDINSGRTHLYTLKTVNAIAPFGIFYFTVFLPGLTSYIVIGYDNRVFIEQNTLQPAIRANHDTNLFTHIAVNKEENTGKKKEGNKSTQMSANRF